MSAKRPRKYYAIDLPCPEPLSDGSGMTWKNFTDCRSRKAAERLLKNLWGIQPQYADLFITEGEQP